VGARDIARVIALRFAATAVVGLGLLPAAAAGARTHHHAPRPHPAPLNPVIFVHGFEGSGSQFESQAMRLGSNGYPASWIGVLEYDSTQYAGAIAGTGVTPQQEAPLFDQLDQLIAHMKAVTHRPKVELLAHSLGTFLMQDYLNSSKQRAANVAHYVNIDGRTADSPPGGVKTLAVFGTRGPLSDQPGRQIKGAKNVFIPDSTHVQTATSPLTFYYFYKFFTGKPPKYTEILPRKGKITLDGRDVNFPENTGLSGATVQLWAINQATGQRVGSAPIYSTTVGSTGDFGPITVQSGRRYEFAEVRPGFPTHHFYYEPFVHTDHLVRLLESDALRNAGGPSDPRSMAMVIVRYKELWGDQGPQSDVLTINRQSVCNPTTCPLSKEVNGLFAADFNHDGQSETGQTWPTYQNVSQYFISSVDIFAPAASPPRGKVTVAIRSRGVGPVRTITFPNFESTSDDVTVQLDDFDKTASPRAAKPKPKCAARHRRRGARCRRVTPR
jgi:pimeloyl-ACP methyl ester carboxylesterase